MKYWTIAPLFLGRLVRDKSFLIYFKDPGVKIDIGILAWLLLCEDEKIIVDTGPSPLKETAEFHMPFFQAPEQRLEAQLKRFNTSPDEIKIVIYTHLHWDHCYQNFLFKKANIFVQKKELDYAKNPLPVQVKAYDVGQEGIVPPFRGVDFEVIEGDMEPAPGIEILLSPGHTPGMQTVCVKTREGVYILAGDTLPLYENMNVPEGTPYLPNGIYVDLKKYYKSLDRIKKMDGCILPGHDLQVLKKIMYP